ncbi:hypothetical protein BX616_009843 [Lobosporangium transversale]|uniref:FAD-binding domain-containing protein n=1 Tax=Lobosporangium transversale TaxID=64571 RepID=A0A1Y2GHT1_9FUNG|nr:hypothetical protein BCR41DRAFT_387752 [Lobosporangium transversale]KAF9913592.1 hypothetical protein BX616_009843 [Lobosporangium transversale]ORZ11297.1 hypothetical protein BCR41DRAFT_387752 [Lobosporangium transversale]|eukprot:XP_021879612.1 hypothetical protein BCR41DRAFT_387752 [Lobosporangium transversale]
MEVYPSQPPPINSDGKTPHVIIVGAGLAGLFLAILLDRQGVPYDIYERSKEVKPLGALMSLNANILPVFEQLGILDELLQVSFPSAGFFITKSNLKPIASLMISNQEKLFGYRYLLFARPKLHDILLSRVPPERIHMNKKVMSIAQNSRQGVMIRCSDNTTYHGDILVGADGAYSGVRQSLYKMMHSEGILQDSDTKSLSMNFTCLVGTTDSLDPEKYPILKEKEAKLHQVIGNGTQYTWSAVNVPEHRICWNVVSQFPSAVEAEDERFRNSEWGPAASETMTSEVRDFLLPIGGTIGDLIDATPKESISRVFLEDKIFETWYHMRTVLIGDACHKLLPSAGQGAVNAFQDAVILANCIYDLKSLAQEDIIATFKDYRDQRYPHVIEQYEASKMNAKIIYGQKLSERVIRNIVLNYMPKSVQVKNAAKNMAYRPQATFLPLPPKRGISPVLPQKPSRRYMEEQAKLKQTQVK